MSILFDPYVLYMPRHTSLALSISLVAHAILFGTIGWKAYQQHSNKNIKPTLSIVLVNRKTSTSPNVAYSWAQANLNGGGTSDQTNHTARVNHLNQNLVGAEEAQENENTHSESSSTAAPQQAQEKQDISTPYLTSRTPSQVKIRPLRASELKLVQQDSQQELQAPALNLAAKLSHTQDKKQEGPESKVLGARTREYRFATYFAQWRAKIERVGTAYYRQVTPSGQTPPHGNVSISLRVRADGQLASATIRKSSGNEKIDKMMIEIAHKASPFPPFPDALRSETSVHEITSNWKFEKSDQLETGDD